MATVFARQEFESWLMAGFDSFSHQMFPDGRRFRSDVSVPDSDLDESPKDAKDWLRTAINGGDKPTRDQATLTQWLDIDSVRQRNSRSFRRLESGINELVAAIQADDHVATPAGARQVESL